MRTRAVSRVLPGWFTRLGLLLLAPWLSVLPAGAVTAPPGFVVENAFPGQTFFHPVQVVFMPDGRKLVVEQAGVIWILSAQGQRSATPFIDLTVKVIGTDDGRGLLGVALDPDFDVNRWVYLAYTVDPDSSGTDQEYEAYSRIERYQTDGLNPDILDLASRQVLIGTGWDGGIPMTGYYHSIGALRFASDKTLLIASGDGAHFEVTDAGGFDPIQFQPGRADPAEDVGSFRSLTLNSLCGKVLRVDKETGLGLPSNPYWDGNPISDRSRTWVYGLRNPYRFCLRPGTGSPFASDGQPGTLFIGDTGWNEYESVKVAAQGGANLGWPCMEGGYPQPLYQAVTQTAANNPNVICSAPPSFENPAAPTPPLIWWHHSNGSLSNPSGWTGAAVIGGTFHDGGSYPEPYVGSYFVAEYGYHWIRWVKLDAANQILATGDFLNDVVTPSNLEWDPLSGDMHYIDWLAGQVFRVRYTTLGNQPRALVARADSSNGSNRHPIPGNGSPWKDLFGTHHLTLQNFNGNTASGWQGIGTVYYPYALRFDGVNDRATIPAGSIAELQSSTSNSVALWFSTGNDVTTPQYLIEWLAAYSAPYAGMSLQVAEDSLRVRLDDWVAVAKVNPNTWYHVAVAKAPAAVNVYVNGELVYSGIEPNSGDQVSDLVLGASTYRGAGLPGEFFDGSISRLEIWPVSLTTSDVLSIFQGSQAAYVPFGLKMMCVKADSADGTGPPAVPSATSPWKDLIAGHDLGLTNFAGNATSGWTGDGTAASRYRLAFDGVNDRATLPARAVPELQALRPVTVTLWIKTGLDVTTTQYLFEWVANHSAPYPGMTLAVSNGRFRIRTDQWIDVAALEPNAWYHVAVTKDASVVRAYVNGSRRYLGTISNLGIQNSEIVVGASTFRGAGQYGEFFRGSVAAVCLWRKALIDPEVQEAFHADEFEYLGAPALAPKVFAVRADSATGTGPYPVPSDGTPWADLINSNDFTLSGFEGIVGSGWEGAGSPSSPYRLRLDGVDDRVTLPANSVTELQSPSAVTAALWIRTGNDVTSLQYLIEWLDTYSSNGAGMSIAIQDEHFRSSLNPWVDVAPAEPNTWYHLAMTKEPGLAQVYVNGRSVYLGANTNLGAQNSEVVLGSSTFRGPGSYGEPFSGWFAQASVWAFALNTSGVRAMYLADSARYHTPFATDVPTRHSATRVAVHPNPFQGVATIEFSLPREADVELSIFGIDGRLVRTMARGRLASGSHRSLWDGRDKGGRAMKPGLYYARLATTDGSEIRRVVLLR